MIKPPRAYFAAYLKADGDREKEREALQGLPEEWRPLLATYIKINEARKNEKK